MMLRCQTSMVRLAVLTFSVAVLQAGVAQAVVVVSSADQVCDPAADPCVIDQVFELTAPLDFGFRQVHVTDGGRLRGAVVALTAGSILIDVGPSTNAGAIEAEFEIALTARALCSTSTSQSCFFDTHCPDDEICDTAAAIIDIDGRFTARTGEFSANAAGDIGIDGVVNVSGLGAGRSGGTIGIESTLGSVTIGAKLNAASSSSSGYYGYSGGGGYLELHAGLDLDIVGATDFSGRSQGGGLELKAQRDIILRNEMDGSGGNYSYATGGLLYARAYRDFRMLRPPSVGRELVTDVSGGGVFYDGYDGGYWHSGSGGDVEVFADGKIEIGDGMTVKADAGPGAYETQGGYVYLYSEGDASVGGRVLSRGLGAPSGGIAGDLDITSGEGSVTLESTGVLDVTANHGNGFVSLISEERIDVEGRIDIQALGGFFENGEGIGSPGVATLRGFRSLPDVSISGQIVGGGTSSSYGPTSIEACHLRLNAGALIDLRRGPPNEDAQDFYASSAESFVVADGARILLDVDYGESRFFYRPEKRPLLIGNIEPPPILSGSIVAGCPRCGNFEVDQSETCDDGNTDSGDGCDSDCVNEACIAATAGWPESDLCNDNDNCTDDRCDVGEARCEHTVSCNDQIDCTEDSCVPDGSCSHRAADALCDDANDCTEDSCSEATGCIAVPLNAVDCEDYDPCTTGTNCTDGQCGGDELRRVARLRLGVNYSKRTQHDSARMAAVVDSADLPSDPRVTGLFVRLSDEFDDEIWSYAIPGDRITDIDGSGVRYRYNLRERRVDGVPARRIRLNLLRDSDSGKSILKLHLRGADLSMFKGHDIVTVAWALGAGLEAQHCVSAWRTKCTSRRQRFECRH